VKDRFNASKSNLKFLESAALGAAIVVSDVQTYSDVARDGINSLVVPNDAEAWYHALRRLIVNADLRARLAVQARSDVQARHTIAHLIPLYREVIQAARAAR
jgi:glycosyltransferase involved in cell wall biosynthesis